MGFFKSIENKLEGLVEGGFGRAFKSSVQPVELAHKLAKEMGDHKTVGVSNVYVPNEFEIYLGDASTFADELLVWGKTVGGHKVLATSSPAIPNAIAAILLDLRDRMDASPHAYFGWTEGNPITYLLKFLAFGEGDTAPVTREVLRQAEPNPERRPRIHIG